MDTPSWIHHARLRECVALAGEIPPRPYRLAALVFNRYGEKVGTGYNQYLPNPLPNPSDYGYPPWANIHAEQAALLNAGWDRSDGGVLYVARVTKAGAPNLAKPCQGCFNLALAAGIRYIYYTTYEKNSFMLGYSHIDLAPLPSPCYNGAVLETQTPASPSLEDNP